MNINRQDINWKELRLAFSWAFGLGKRYKKRLSLYTFIGLLEVGLGLYFIWISKQTIDIATHVVPGNLALTVTLLAISLIFQIGLQLWSSWLSSTLSVEVGNGLRRDLFATIMRSRWNELEKYHTGDIITRIQEDVTELVRFFTSTIPNTIITAAQLTASFLFLLSLDARLAFAILGIAPIFFIIGKLYVRNLKHYNLEIKQKGSKITSVIQESIQHRAVLKSLEYDSTNLEQLDGMQSSLISTVKEKTKMSLILQSTLTGGFSGGYLVAFIWGIFSLSKGVITFGTMTAFLQLVNRIQRPAIDLIRTIPGLVTTYTSIERLLELVKLTAEEEGDAIALEGPLTLTFDHVDFAYDRDNVLKSFSHTFKAGSITAVVGETGSGKSTLMRLILALLRPQAGQIYLSTPEHSIEVSALTRCNIVYVPQGNSLFSGSIRDNLLMGNPTATEEEMWQALHVACADFVADFPNSLDTSLTELGGGLSEGQAQRLSIARGLLRSGNLLLLDEVTSALDIETEKAIIDNLKHTFQNKTTIVITHRQEILRICDSIVEITPQSD